MNNKGFSSKFPVIAIIGGTGKEGPGLALRWAIRGYPIIIGSRQAEKAEQTAAKLNEQLQINVIKGYQNNLAARLADICVLTVVFSAHESAVLSIKEELQGKILVDATARIDFRNPRPPEPPSAARIAQNILGEKVRVAAALQNIPAHSLRSNLEGSIDADVLVCSDDLSAADQVIELVKAAGMNAYYAGGLDNAVVVEGLTSILISLNKHYGVSTASIRVTGVNHPPR